jgi:hypothetical protein
LHRPFGYSGEPGCAVFQVALRGSGAATANQAEVEMPAGWQVYGAVMGARTGKRYRASPDKVVENTA